jgi:hypothetical protein
MATAADVSVRAAIAQSIGFTVQVWGDRFQRVRGLRKKIEHLETWLSLLKDTAARYSEEGPQVTLRSDQCGTTRLFDLRTCMRAYAQVSVGAGGPAHRLEFLQCC